jgi:hypothetical protein
MKGLLTTAALQKQGFSANFSNEIVKSSGTEARE